MIHTDRDELLVSSYCSVILSKNPVCYHFIHVVLAEGWTVLCSSYLTLASCISVKEQALSHLAFYSVQYVHHRLVKTASLLTSGLLLP